MVFCLSVKVALLTRLHICVSVLRKVAGMEENREGINLMEAGLQNLSETLDGLEG